MTNIIKAQRAIVKFCEGVEVDGYKLPSGEFRVGKAGASVAVGYGKDWVGQLAGKSLKALQDNGFTGSEKVVNLDLINGGGATAKTLSLQDFRKLIIFAASKGKPKAAALLDAIVDIALEDWLRLSFGESTLDLVERRQAFYSSYVHSIDWQQEDRLDWQVIEDQQLFLSED